PGGQLARGLRLYGPTVRGGRPGPGPAEGQPGVRRPVGPARGGPALRRPQDPGPPRAGPDRTGLPGAVYRGSVPAPAGPDRPAAHRGLREARAAVGPGPA